MLCHSFTFNPFITHIHCLKSIHIWRFSGPYFTAFGLNMERFSRNAGKYGPEKLRIRTLFTQWSQFTSVLSSILLAFAEINTSIDTKLVILFSVLNVSISVLKFSYQPSFPDFIRLAISYGILTPLNKSSLILFIGSIHTSNGRKHT